MRERVQEAGLWENLNVRDQGFLAPLPAPPHEKAGSRGELSGLGTRPARSLRSHFPPRKCGWLEGCLRTAACYNYCVEMRSVGKPTQAARLACGERIPRSLLQRSTKGPGNRAAAWSVPCSRGPWSKTLAAKPGFPSGASEKMKRVSPALARERVGKEKRGKSNSRAGAVL